MSGLGAVDDLLRDERQDGYEEGCADGYAKAMQDLKEALEDPAHEGRTEAFECVQEAARKGTFA